MPPGFGRAIVSLLARLHSTPALQVVMRNRRIGCSVSGVAQFIAHRGLAELRTWLEAGYEVSGRMGPAHWDASGIYFIGHHHHHHHHQSSSSSSSSSIIIIVAVVVVGIIIIINNNNQI